MRLEIQSQATVHAHPGSTFPNFLFGMCRTQGTNWKRVAFLMKDKQCTSVLSYGSLKAIIIRQLSRIESISPVWNIVTEVRIRVGEDTADVLCFRKFCYRSRWLMWPGPPVGRTTGRYVLLLHLASKYNQGKYECRALTSTCLGRMRDRPARWCTM